MPSSPIKTAAGYGVATLIALATSVYIFAAPPLTPYAPNETSDPACAPGDPNCYVQLVDNDNQTLTASGSSVSINGGNTLSLASMLSGNDRQNLSVSGSTLNIERGTGVDLGTLMSANDDQTLSISGSTLSIANGNSVTLPAGAVADNLGNHTATSNIHLGSNWLSGDGGNEGVHVGSTGNVGIGTANPLAKLHVDQSARISDSDSKFTDIYGGFIRLSHGVGSGLWGEIDIYSGASVNNRLWNIANRGDSGNLIFRSMTDDRSSSTDTLMLSRNGNVGIGTSAPIVKLDVEGVIRIGRQDSNREGAEFYMARGSDNAIQFSMDVFRSPLDELEKLRIFNSMAGEELLTLSTDGLMDLNKGNTTTGCASTTAGAIRYNNAINKHEGCNGTAWNALY